MSLFLSAELGVLAESHMHVEKGVGRVEPPLYFHQTQIEV